MAQPVYGGIEAGLHAGIGVPFHGPYGELSGVALASSDRGQRVDTHTIRELELLSHQFHIAHLALALPAHAADPRLPSAGSYAMLWA